MVLQRLSPSSLRGIACVILSAVILLLPHGVAAQIVESGSAPESKQTDGNESAGILQVDFDKAPTLIKSKTLTLHSNARKFEYEGAVEVVQGDLTLTCDTLEGLYDKNNQIQKLIAHENVVIVKGEEIRASSERAVYERSSETITLTESPELLQNDSVLTADLIRIFLNEDRSLAEGQVRVKLVEEKEDPGKEKGKRKKKATS